MAGKLSAVAIKGLVKPGRYSDGGGLHLYVRDADKRSWVLRYTIGDRRRDMGLGDFPALTLKDARDRADAARAHLKEGRDPLDARRAAEAESEGARTRTFKAAAEAMLADKAKGWRNAKHRAQWNATLEGYAYPTLGSMPVAAIGTDDVLAVLRPVWERAPETASRLRGRIEAVLDAAAASGWREGPNPARWKGHLSARLPKPRSVKPQRHHPALAYAEMGDFMAALAKREGTAAKALAFAILTAARTGEVRGMTWGEVDLAERVWTVPGARMKAGRAHRVPLSPGAAAILAAMKPANPRAAALVFPGERAGKSLSDMTLSAVVRRMNELGADPADPDAPPRWRDAEGRAVVPHGFRSTFRDWAGETRADPREVVERCLAHTIRDKVEAAYARGDLLERRRPVIDAWGAFCAISAGAKVKRLKAAG